VENKCRDLSDLPMTLRVEDLMPILGIGRNTAYELIRCWEVMRL
jgi:predicted DNA-binding transcriptional regulator AlpA